jgi:hypothetical protein
MFFSQTISRKGPWLPADEELLKEHFGHLLARDVGLNVKECRKVPEFNHWKTIRKIDDKQLMNKLQWLKKCL